MPAALPHAQVARRELAAHYLRMLLTDRGRYRASWARRADKVPPSEISQAAVARVIAEYLQTRGELPYNDHQAYRPLKDRVYRALSGQALTPATLSLFAKAFLFSQDDAQHLWSLLLGTTPEEATNAIRGMSLPPSLAAAFQPSKFRIISLEETLVIGTDRLPKEHRSRQLIAAETNGLSRLPIRFDTDSPKIDVMNASRTDIYRCPDGLYAIDILLPTVLQSGQEAEVQYKLWYQSGTSNDDEFRRSARRPIDRAIVRVQFSDKRQPKKIWWAIWQELNQDAPILREEIKINPDDYTVQKTVFYVDKTIFGFCWEW